MTTQPNQPQKPRPGWYRDPDMANTQRYWDGEQWTEHLAPGAPHRRTQTHPNLVGWGIVTAFFVPIVGFVIGCILVSRQPGKGIAIMVLSLVMTIVWVNHFTSSSTGF